MQFSSNFSFKGFDAYELVPVNQKIAFPIHSVQMFVSMVRIPAPGHGVPIHT